MGSRTAARPATVAAACLIAAGFVSVPAARGQPFHWVQHAPGGLEARAITDAAACPPARLDGTEAAMTVRAEPGEGYPVRVCALPIPAGTRTAAIADVPLALPMAAPRRIAVIGDTGCRLKGSYVQACNDPRAWPFRLVAEVVAQLAPDLVVHVGDYHYRETACPAGEAGCAGSPFGDTWAVWRADFFAPAETLLRVAPWVFVRGNHEECGRGGKGWSRALEPYAFAGASGCNAASPPFAVRLPGLTLAVMDVASAREESVNEAQAALYREHYRALGAMIGSGPAWILQHRPIWSAGGMVGGKLIGDNKTLAAAAAGNIPAQVSLMLSGHHHIFQVLDYGPWLPVQAVSGHGGDTLNEGPALDPTGWVINGVPVRGGLNIFGVFGFALLEAAGEGGWRITAYDRLGRALRSCTVADRSASCPPG